MKRESLLSRARKEIAGRKEYGDRLKAENAELTAGLREARKELREIKTWVSENTPFDGRMPGQVVRTLVCLQELWQIAESSLREQQEATRRWINRARETREENDRLRARVAELEAQRDALADRLRAGQRWQPGRRPALVSQDYVSQDELRAMFGIPLTAPWDDVAGTAVDGITRRIAPTQARGEDEDVTPQVEKLRALLAGQRADAEGEHYAVVHHEYHVPRDLPDMGGAQ